MSKLLTLLPKFITKDPVMAAVAEAIGKPLDQWMVIIKKLPTYVDPATAPESWLNPLMALVALPRNDGLAEGVKRLLITVAFRTWFSKGTEPGIEGYLKAFVGLDADVVRLNTSSFVAGVNKAGDINGTLGGLAWSFEVHVPASSGFTENEIRTLLVPVVAVYEQYTVVFT